MFTSADYRAYAKNVLRGKWRIAALTSFIASLIGATIIGYTSSGLEFSDGEIETITANFSDAQVQIFTKILFFILIYSVVRGIASFIIGGACQIGYAHFNLNIADGKEAAPSDLFSQFGRLGDGFLMNLLRSIYLIGWSMLFVIPGIIKLYSYSMTPYLMSEFPFLSPNEAITESRRVMDGKKLDLFLLHLSFLGWGLLASIPSAIALSGLIFGNFMLLPLYFVTVVAHAFLNAYMEAAQAAFYRQITWRAPEEAAADSTES
ncbi:MAG: DUF975 family protein [Clostridia bacterium]|nr:DUF975 family protein [Clostridia bacterium]